MTSEEPTTILLVDVSGGHLRQLEPRLHAAGLHTLLAQDYQQALAEARNGKFDLVIIGECLVDIDDVDLPRIINCVNAAARLPIIWMPPRADARSVMAILDLNIDLVLDAQTPFDVLLSYIHAQIRKKRRTDELMGSLDHLRGLVADQARQMNQLQDNNDQLRALSVTDPLTGLFNARYMDQWLNQAFAYARRYDKPLSVVFIDLDHLKWINDRYGHRAGDAALKFLATVLRNCVRDSDLVARYAGDEFLLALPDTPADRVDALTQRILDELKASPVVTGGEEYHITCSMGAATYPAIGPAAAHQELLEYADQALYAAKRSGRAQLAQWHRVLPGPQQEATPGIPDPVHVN